MSSISPDQDFNLVYPAVDATRRLGRVYRDYISDVGLVEYICADGETIRAGNSTVDVSPGSSFDSSWYVEESKEIKVPIIRVTKTGSQWAVVQAGSLTPTSIPDHEYCYAASRHDPLKMIVEVDEDPVWLTEHFDEAPVPQENPKTTSGYAYTGFQFTESHALAAIQAYPIESNVEDPIYLDIPTQISSRVLDEDWAHIRLKVQLDQFEVLGVSCPDVIVSSGAVSSTVPVIPYYTLMTASWSPFSDRAQY